MGDVFQGPGETFGDAGIRVSTTFTTTMLRGPTDANSIFMVHCYVGNNASVTSVIDNGKALTKLKDVQTGTMESTIWYKIQPDGDGTYTIFVQLDGSSGGNWGVIGAIFRNCYAQAPIPHTQSATNINVTTGQLLTLLYSSVSSGSGSFSSTGGIYAGYNSTSNCTWTGYGSSSGFPSIVYGELLSFVPTLASVSFHCNGNYTGVDYCILGAELKSEDYILHRPIQFYERADVAKPFQFRKREDEKQFQFRKR